MALEFGSGTQADPYLLVNLADVTALFTSHLSSGKYFALISDLDFSANLISYKSNTPMTAKINGRGHRLFVKLNNTQYQFIFGGWGSGVFENIWIKFIYTAYYTPTTNNDGVSVLNSIIEFSSKSVAYQSFPLIRATNSIIIGGDIVLYPSVNTYKHGDTTANTINTGSFSNGNPFDKKNYVGLTEDKWVFDGISLPRPRPQATADLTTRYGIKGHAKVGGNGRQRNLAVFTENGLRYKVQDTKADGSFFLNLNDVSTPVIVMAYDDIGAKAAINTAYSLNQIIHPATPNGFRYRCTLAGNSGATIPPEPWPTSAVLTIGAAKFTPEPVYEPKAHGPLLPVLFNVVTEQPV